MEKKIKNMSGMNILKLYEDLNKTGLNPEDELLFLFIDMQKKNVKMAQMEVKSNKGDDIILRIEIVDKNGINFINDIVVNEKTENIKTTVPKVV